MFRPSNHLSVYAGKTICAILPRSMISRYNGVKRRDVGKSICFHISAFSDTIPKCRAIKSLVKYLVFYEFFFGAFDFCTGYKPTALEIDSYCCPLLWKIGFDTQRLECGYVPIRHWNAWKRVWVGCVIYSGVSLC